MNNCNHEQTSACRPSCFCEDVHNACVLDFVLQQAALLRVLLLLDRIICSHRIRRIACNASHRGSDDVPVPADRRGEDSEHAANGRLWDAAR